MRAADGRLANGRFAEKSRPAGRKKGTPNKTTRPIKEFLAALADDNAVQGAVRERILAGDAVAFFRAVDHVLGKPKESVDVTLPQADLVLQRLMSGLKRKSDGKSSD
jgi:hypothetical protein